MEIRNCFKRVKPILNMDWLQGQSCIYFFQLLVQVCENKQVDKLIITEPWFKFTKKEKKKSLSI